LLGSPFAGAVVLRGGGGDERTRCAVEGNRPEEADATELAGPWASIYAAPLRCQERLFLESPSTTIAARTVTL